MAAATEPLLMTVEQYRQLPDREDVIQELHWGMVVTLSRPKMRHAKLQSRLVRLLRPKSGAPGCRRIRGRLQGASRVRSARSGRSVCFTAEVGRHRR